MRFEESHAEPVELSGDADLQVHADACEFRAPVVIRGCRVTHLGLYATYFLQGLRLVDCVVEGPVVFQSGGHNRRPIELQDTEFLDTVDFEDSWFMHEVVLRRVQFRKGTNLLGNPGTPVEVQFDRPPVLEDVVGQLDLTTYGRGSRSRS